MVKCLPAVSLSTDGHFPPSVLPGNTQAEMTGFKGLLKARTWFNLVRSSGDAGAVYFIYNHRINSDSH